MTTARPRHGFKVVLPYTGTILRSYARWSYAALWWELWTGYPDLKSSEIGNAVAVEVLEEREDARQSIQTC